MLLSIFTSMYEAVIGANPNYPEYREGIFSSVGLFTLVISIVICLLFYVALGRWRPVFHKAGHWVLTLVLVALIAFLLAYFQAKGTLAVADSYTMRFGLFNALYGALYFILCSFIFKRFSIFAKHTPFKL